MSVSPLPVHMSCFGISADAVTAARGTAHGYSKPTTFGDRLATAKATAAKQYALEQASSQHAPAPTPGGGPPAAAQSQTRQAPQVKLQPIPAESVHQYIGSSSAGGGSPPGPTGGSAAASNLAYRAHTKHCKSVAPTLQALDFISIAVNSVGGGGVPRPYGKFTACRSGDGNATWERLPPPPGSWQARALPIAVTLLGEGQAPPPAQSSPYGSSGAAPSPRHRGANAALPSNRGGSDEQAAAAAAAAAAAGNGSGGGSGSRLVTPVSAIDSPRSWDEDEEAAGAGGEGPNTSGLRDISGLRLGFSSATEPTRHNSAQPDPYSFGRSTYPGPGRSRSGSHGGGHVRGGLGSTTGRKAPGALSSSSSPAAPSGAGAGGLLTARILHQQSYYRRPGSSLHRSLVSLPPPEPNNFAAWFALPAATFLADVPAVPEQLRMDNGYSVSRDFLMSGLNPPRQRPGAASPPRSPSPPRRPPLSPFLAPQPGPEQHRPEPEPEPNQQQQQQQELSGELGSGPEQEQVQEQAERPSSTEAGSPTLQQQQQQPATPSTPQAYSHTYAHGGHYQQTHHSNQQLSQPTDRQLLDPGGDRQRAVGYHQPVPEARLGDRRVLWEALEKGGQAQTHNQAAAGGSKLRGVYVPLDRRSPAGERPPGWEADGEGGTGGFGGYEANPSLLAGGGGTLRGSFQLPSELALPRRNIPAGR